MDAHDTVTVEEGDRYPLRPPICIIPSVAQSGSAPALGAGGPRFESLYSDQY